MMHWCLWRISPLSLSTLYFPNTLALTPFPIEDRFNLWYRPIFGGRRLIFRPITHRGILNPFEGCGYFGPYLLADKPIYFAITLKYTTDIMSSMIKMNTN